MTDISLFFSNLSKNIKRTILLEGGTFFLNETKILSQVNNLTTQDLIKISKVFGCKISEFKNMILFSRDGKDTNYFPNVSSEELILFINDCYKSSSSFRAPFEVSPGTFFIRKLYSTLNQNQRNMLANDGLPANQLNDTSLAILNNLLIETFIGGFIESASVFLQRVEFINDSKLSVESDSMYITTKKRTSNGTVPNKINLSNFSNTIKINTTSAIEQKMNQTIGYYVNPNGLIKSNVHESLKDKSIAIFGKEFATEDTIYRSIAELFAVRSTNVSGVRTLSQQRISQAFSLTGWYANLRTYTPKPFLTGLPRLKRLANAGHILSTYAPFILREKGKIIHYQQCPPIVRSAVTQLLSSEFLLEIQDMFVHPATFFEYSSDLILKINIHPEREFQVNFSVHGRSIKKIKELCNFQIRSL